jgi:hypothetical protein
MKWIGQHIHDKISRLRNDVYLEDISTGTIASGGNLGLDSNNKIVKATTASGDLTSIVAGTGLSGTSLTGPIPTLTIDAQQFGITDILNEELTIGSDPEKIIDFRTENKIFFKIGNANQLSIENGAIIPTVNNDIDLGSDSTEQFFKDLYLRGNANIEGNVAGTWTGNIITSAKLDADTAHLTTTQTFTGVKTFNEAINKKALHFLYTANKFTTDTSVETYFSLSDADRDTTNEDGVGIMAVVPLTGVLKHVLINCSSNLSGKTWEFRVYRVPSGADADSGGEILIATVASNAGPAGHTNKKISFVSGTADTNVITYETGYTAATMFTAGDRVLLSIQSNSDAAGSPKINSVLCFELDESTI